MIQFFLPITTHQFITAHERYKAYKIATNKNYIPHQLGLIAQIILYLIPGIVIFLFLPSLIFSYFEEWTYSVAIYYSFVTLSTIGFGDYVPTFAPHQVCNIMQRKKQSFVLR